MVIIEGHTDADKIPKGLEAIYPTNWELSAARASNVVNYLISQGVNSGRLQASGYADRWPADVSWYDVRSGKNAIPMSPALSDHSRMIFTSGYPHGDPKYCCL